MVPAVVLTVLELVVFDVPALSSEEVSELSSEAALVLLLKALSEMP